MALAVVHPPVSVDRDFIDYPFFADLGAVQLAAVLEQAEPDTDCVLVDAYALPGAGLTWTEGGRARLGVDANQVVDALSRRLGGSALELVFVAFTPFHRPPSRDPLLGDLLDRLRTLHPKVPIVLVDAYQSGQHYVEADAETVLAAYPEVTTWLKYEAEIDAPRLVAMAREGSLPAVIRGERPDLDALPVPAWDRIDLEAYDAFRASILSELGRPSWAFPFDGRTLPAVTSRGCPFRCLHCSSNPDAEPDQPKTQRRLSPERLQKHVAALAAAGAERVYVLDELINVRAPHFDAFLDAVESHDLRFEIPNGMRADYLGPEHFARMRGRCTTVSVSAESGVQRVVDEVVGKQLDLGRIREAAQHAQAAGVPLMIHYMIGLPGETPEEINGTLGFALELFDEFGAEPAVQYATPLPGTRLARQRDSLPVVSDWGPRFQRDPTASNVDAPTLQRFMDTFRDRLAQSRGPTKLIMNVTYACNNHCTFCAVGTRTQIDGHPPRQREHLERYAELGVHMVDFDGGEPTLNPELIPLIRHARTLGYDRINVTTNGRRCVYEPYARALVRSGLTTLLFSVHGADARTHAQQVGVAEAYQQTTDGIRNCVRLAPPGVELGMNVTLTKGNHEQLDEMVQLAWDLGLPWVNVQFLTPFGRATRMIAPDPAEAAAITMRVIDEWHDRVKFQVINLPYCFMPGYEGFMQGDMAKLSRHMAFVNNETVNLAEYLAERRVRKPVCAPCPHACFCGGFYELDEVPEPQWLIAPEDLLRSIDDPRRHESVPAGFHDRVRRRLDAESG
jgi:MoaA/NifB/PqqE/SkfB family radical SAM enzyme